MQAAAYASCDRHIIEIREFCYRANIDKQHVYASWISTGMRFMHYTSMSLGLNISIYVFPVGLPSAKFRLQRGTGLGFFLWPMNIDPE